LKKEGEFKTVGRKNPKDAETASSKESSFRNVLKSFMRVKDELKGEEIDIDLLDGLLASEDIDSEVDNVPIGYMLMSSMAAEAEERYENQKIAIKFYRGELNEKAHDGAITARVTDSKVEAFIDRDVKYLKMVRRLNKYKKQMTVYVQAYKAYDIKSSMLQTKSANRRKLMENDVPTNPKKAHDKIMGTKKRES
jgi:hypothetical protein